MASIRIIDGEEQVHAVLRGILEEAGYMDVVASNGQQGSGRFSPPHRDSRAGMTDQKGAPRAAVLRVDDDPDICEVLTDLVRYEGYDEEHTWSGTDVLAKSSSRRRSVPSSSMCTCPIRTEGSYAWTYANGTGRAAHHAHRHVGLRKHALHSGAFVCIVKPDTKTELLEILCRATGRT
jgi:hypothetical protein